MGLIPMTYTVAIRNGTVSIIVFAPRRHSMSPGGLMSAVRQLCEWKRCKYNQQKSAWIMCTC